MRFDTIITGGTVFDGTGAGGRALDVGIRGGVIVAVEDPAMTVTDVLRSPRTLRPSKVSRRVARRDHLSHQLAASDPFYRSFYRLPINEGHGKRRGT